MRRILALLIFVTLLNILAFAAPERIILRDTGTLPTREGFPLGLDMPDAFYNHDEKTQDIIIDGNGDDVVNINDVTTITEWLEDGLDGVNPYKILAADMDGNGVITVHDVTVLIDYLLQMNG